MTERFIVLDRVGNGYVMKNTGDRGDGFVVTIPVTVDDSDYWIEPETNVGNSRIYVPNSYDGEILNLHFPAVTPLTDFKIASADIMTIDLSAARDLTFLNLINNELEVLDISRLTSLEYITLWNNSLEELDISSCPNLTHVSLRSNNLDQTHIDDVIFALVDFGLEDGYLSVADMTIPSSDGLAALSVLNERGWNLNYDS